MLGGGDPGTLFLLGSDKEDMVCSVEKEHIHLGFSGRKSCSWRWYNDSEHMLSTFFNHRDNLFIGFFSLTIIYIIDT